MDGRAESVRNRLLRKKKNEEEKKVSRKDESPTSSREPRFQSTRALLITASMEILTWDQ